MIILALAILTMATVPAAPRRLSHKLMTLPIRSASKSTRALTTISLNAPIPRWHSAMPHHRAAPHSALLTRITGVQKRRPGDEIAGIAVTIELRWI